MPQTIKIEIEITKPAEKGRSGLIGFACRIPDLQLEGTGHGINAALRDLGHKMYVSRGNLAGVGTDNLSESGKTRLGRLNEILGDSTASDDEE